MYWVAIKFTKGKAEYLSSWDKNGVLTHSDNKLDAFRFDYFGDAMEWINRGYCIQKEY